MFSYAQTPAMERRNLEDRLARASTRSRHETSPDAGSRTKARSPEAEAPRVADSGRRAAEKILNARGAREVDVEPEARRAADLILSAERPDEDVAEAVDLIKNAGRERDAGEDRDEE